jgi:hypothetical protein
LIPSRDDEPANWGPVVKPLEETEKFQAGVKIFKLFQKKRTAHNEQSATRTTI